VVINEIHHNPDVKTEAVEFIELFNNSPGIVDLSGWYFSDGIEYTFPAGASLPPYGYLVVAQKPSALAAKYGVTNALGPYTNALSAFGEKVTLRDAGGGLQDQVDYGLGFPWPTVGDPPGYSLELINPNLDNDLGGSWRASVASGPTGQLAAAVIPSNSVWKYFKGFSEASTPVTAWRTNGFNDAAWLEGPAPIGYHPLRPMGTPLPDMAGNYSGVFFRKTFVLQNPASVAALLIEALYDDGIKIWINGSNVLNANISAGSVPFTGTATGSREDLTYNQFLLNNPAGYLLPGTNTIAIQAHNSALVGDVDFFLDVQLSALYTAPRVGPTPGRVNSVYATNAPPQTRQVQHSPKQPKAGEAVKITAKVTDPNGVASVALQYQVVEPGNYIDLADAAYTNAANWLTLAMNDAGADGDLVPGDSIYTATIPAAVQVHRRLIRYRLTVADSLGASVRLPYADDPAPNFAYFVYNGVPAWTGAVQPGVTAPFTVSSNEMNRLPVIHLLAKSNNVVNSTWFSRYTGDEYLWGGTLVYDGEVYDHIRYRARGGVWRYSMVKNMWKFDFNRGHDFEARDNWGKKFKVPWRKLNLGANIQQGDYDHRGEQGMFESVGFRFFQLAGVAAPHTAFAQFRIILGPAETLANNQYEGDFWGFYLMIEQEDGRFLEEHDLPDSNFYKMEGGTGTLNNLGPDGPTDKSDLNYILNNYGNTNLANEAWWRTNWNLPKYYSYQTIVQGIHHYDISNDKNFFYYYHPGSRLWETVPWDLDLTWAHNMFRSDASGGGIDRIAQNMLKPNAASGVAPNNSTYNLALSGFRPGLELEFRNRIREIRDLFFNADEAWRVIDEQAKLAGWTTNYPNILDADRAQWDYNPKMSSSTYTPNLNKAGTGRFYQFPRESGTNAALKGSFAATIQLMKYYVNIRAVHLDQLADDATIPARPVLTYTGPTNYPINRLTFRSSGFSGSAGRTFAAIKWRVGEITDTNSPTYDPAKPWKYEIEPVWEWTNAVLSTNLSLPPEVVKIGRRYRVRAQMVDNTGRASNWSLPAELTVGQHENTSELQAHLRVTEIMYNPPAGGVEFIELQNLSPTKALDLSGVAFVEGIEFSFPFGTLLPPGGYVVVANTADLAGFRSLHGVPPEVAIYGPFTQGSLNNAGERLTLVTGQDGQTILSFLYGDGREWPAAADGMGHSLAPLPSALEGQMDGAASYGGNWQASAYRRGSPGRADPVPPPGPLLNELAANTPATNGYAGNDWIELYNPTDTPMVLGSGWYLSDHETNLTKWMIPPDTTIPAHGWVSFDEITGFHNPTNIGFALDADGERVVLSHLPGNGQDRVVDVVVFKAQEPGWTWGRYPDGAPWWRALQPGTREEANQYAPAEVILTEIHYHPPDGSGGADNSADEFIEWFNASTQPIDLFNSNGAWRLDGEVTGVLPANLTLQPGQYLLWLNFDPANSAELTGFRQRLGVTNPQTIFAGPYSGKLPNGSGRVSIERPKRNGGGTGVSWVIVDEAAYSDSTPWPCSSDGDGNSLQRLYPDGAGNNPLNWTGQVPSPGAERLNLPPGVASFVAQPASRVVATNAPVTFSVSLCGTPPYQYQWYFNDAPLAGQTNSQFVIEQANLSDAGYYFVSVQNPAGTVTSAVATLIVQVMPAITQQPQSLVATGYTTVTLSVAASGGEPMGYQWRYNGVDVAGATNAALVFTNVQAAQAGNYQVLVFNAAGSVLSATAALTVRMPARIASGPASARVIEGGSTNFSVIATGEGVLSYQWFFAGAPLPGATAATLNLTNVQASQEGNYAVLASNLYGVHLSTQAYLTVLVMPAYVEQPASQMVRLGEDVTLRAVMSGTQPMGFRWRKNGIEIVPYSLGTDTLFMPSVSFTNSGEYTLVVTNEARPSGQLSARAYITVVDPPVNRSVLTGETVTLRAQVAGRPTLSYQWLFEGIPLPGATGTNLVLPNVAASNSGVYTFITTISNAYVNQSASFPATLAVYETAVAPQITRQPTNVAVLSNTTAQLSVEVSGTEPLSYQWWFNGANLLSVGAGPQLFVNWVNDTNTGAYHVVVTNAAGAVTSAVAWLSLLAPPVFSRQPQDLAVAAGGEAVFESQAEGASPIHYQWIFDSELIGPPSTNGNLILTNITVSQSGGYQVVASNIAGLATSRVAQLQVLEKPWFVIQPANQVVAAGSNVTFQVVAGGATPLYYQWWRNQESPLPGQTNASLNLTNVQIGDAGVYHVVVSNSVGAATSVLAVLAISIPDHDGDGLDDDWEVAHGLNPNDADDALADSDGDGHNNLQEFLAGTDPKDKNSVLRLEISQLVGPTMAETIQFLAISNRSYTVQYRGAMGNSVWVNFANVGPQGTNRLISLTNSLAAFQRYYQVKTPAEP